MLTLLMKVIAYLLFLFLLTYITLSSIMLFAKIVDYLNYKNKPISKFIKYNNYNVWSDINEIISYSKEFENSSFIQSKYREAREYLDSNNDCNSSDLGLSFSSNLHILDECYEKMKEFASEKLVSSEKEEVIKKMNLFNDSLLNAFKIENF